MALHIDSYLKADVIKIFVAVINIINKYNINIINKYNIIINNKYN
jgi:hypothetical protein